MHSNSDKCTSLQYPFILSSHPEHPCAVILHNNQFQLALLLKEEVKKKLNCKNANNFLSTSFRTTLCTYYKITHTNVFLFESFGCYKHPRLKSRFKHHFISTAKGLSLFTVFLFLIKKNKIKKEEKASTKLGNTWNKGKGKHFRKRVNILLHFESDC